MFAGGNTVVWCFGLFPASIATAQSVYGEYSSNALFIFPQQRDCDRPLHHLCSHPSPLRPFLWKKVGSQSSPWFCCLRVKLADLKVRRVTLGPKRTMRTGSERGITNQDPNAPPSPRHCITGCCSRASPGQDSVLSSPNPPHPAEVLRLLSPALQPSWRLRCPKNNRCLWSNSVQSLTGLPEKLFSRRVWQRISLSPGDLHTTSSGTGKPSAQPCCDPTALRVSMGQNEDPEKDFCPTEGNVAVNSFSSTWSLLLLPSSNFREKPFF